MAEAIQIQRPFAKVDIAEIPLEKYNVSIRNKIIKEIAKKTFIELAVAFAFTAVACLFVATPAGMATLAICAVSAIGINILLRSLAGYCKYRLLQLQVDPSKKGIEKQKRFEKVLNFLQYLAPLNFSCVIDTNTRDLLIHEGGHALAAQALIKEPNPRISIKPLAGGVTSYRVGALSRLGEFVGRENSKLLIAAAGPALSVGLATASLGFSLALRKSHPELSRYLLMMSAVSIAQHALYALSALWSSKAQLGHDFVRLMGGGLHPVASVATIVALPIIVRVGFFAYDKIKEHLAKKDALKQHQFVQLTQEQNYKKALNVA